MPHGSGAGLQGRACLAAVSCQFEALSHELLVKPSTQKACGKPFARARERDLPCLSLLVLGCPAAPVSLPRSLSHPGCVCWEGPSRLFLPSSFPGPIDRAVSALRWAPPGPALLTQCSGSRGGFRGRGVQGWEKLRGGCDALLAATGEEEPG